MDSEQGRGGLPHQAKANRTREPKILRIVLDLSIREKERHGDQGAYDHRASTTPEVLGFAHESCQNGAGDRAEV